MSTSQQITEIIVFHLREGINLENLASSKHNPATQAFVQLTNVVKAQQGFIRQFWGHEVEHSNLFVWSIDWESYEHYTIFFKSDEYTSFTSGLSQAFDLEVAAPVYLYTRVANNDAATAAFRSPVTEVAFFTMPTRPDEETMSAAEASSVKTVREVQTIGKASGAAIGWVFDAVPRAAVTGPDSISVYGVFGYASIEVHMKWRETPEGIRAGEGNETIRPAIFVPGIDPNTGYFHVKFCEGI